MKTAVRYKANSRQWAVVAAYAAGEISEGMACAVLARDRMALREMLIEACAVAAELEDRYRSRRLTVADDLRTEVAMSHRCRCDD